MSGLSITIGQVPMVLNVIARILIAVGFLALLFPLAIKEAKVKNGLKMLRYEMLVTIGVVFFVNTIGLVVIVLDSLNINTDTTIEIITTLNTIAFFVFLMAKRFVYTQHYTPENKHLHERFDRMEQAALKRRSLKKKK